MPSLLRILSACILHLAGFVHEDFSVGIYIIKICVFTT